jgi:hypothetical protein
MFEDVPHDHEIEARVGRDTREPFVPDECDVSRGFEPGCDPPVILERVEPRAESATEVKDAGAGSRLRGGEVAIERR